MSGKHASGLLCEGGAAAVSKLRSCGCKGLPKKAGMRGLLEASGGPELNLGLFYAMRRSEGGLREVLVYALRAFPGALFTLQSVFCAVTPAAEPPAGDQWYGGAQLASLVVVSAADGEQAAEPAVGADSEDNRRFSRLRRVSLCLSGVSVGFTLGGAGLSVLRPDLCAGAVAVGTGIHAHVATAVVAANALRRMPFGGERRGAALIAYVCGVGLSVAAQVAAVGLYSPGSHGGVLRPCALGGVVAADICWLGAVFLSGSR